MKGEFPLPRFYTETTGWQVQKLCPFPYLSFSLQYITSLHTDISFFQNFEKVFAHLSHLSQGYSLLTFFLACMILLVC